MIVGMVRAVLRALVGICFYLSIIEDIISRLLNTAMLDQAAPAAWLAHRCCGEAPTALITDAPWGHVEPGRGHSVLRRPEERPSLSAAGGRRSKKGPAPAGRMSGSAGYFHGGHIRIRPPIGS